MDSVIQKKSQCGQFVVKHDKNCILLTKHSKRTEFENFQRLAIRPTRCGSRSAETVQRLLTWEIFTLALLPRLWHCSHSPNSVLTCLWLPEFSISPTFDWVHITQRRILWWTKMQRTGNRSLELGLPQTFSEPRPWAATFPHLSC